MTRRAGLRLAEVNASPQAPTIHITVTGLTNDSHIPSGFANLVYNPTLNGIRPAQSVVYQSDDFAPNANWYSKRRRTSPTPADRIHRRLWRGSWPVTPMR